METEKTAVTAGAAAVFVDGLSVDFAEEDAEADFAAGGVGLEEEFDGLGEGGFVGMEQGASEASEVGGRGAQRPGSGEGIEIPGLGFFVVVVGRGKALSLGFIGESDGVLHAEGAGDFFGDEVGPGLFVEAGEDFAEEANAEVGVVDREGAVGGEFGGFEGVAELGAIKVGVGIVGIGADVKIGRKAGKAAGVGGELFEGDFSHAWISELLFDAKDAFERGIKGGLSFGNGLGEKQSGEDFGDGADFEEDFFGRDVFGWRGASEGSNGGLVAFGFGGDDDALVFWEGFEGDLGGFGEWAGCRRSGGGHDWRGGDEEAYGERREIG